MRKLHTCPSVFALLLGLGASACGSSGTSGGTRSDGPAGANAGMASPGSGRGDSASTGSAGSGGGAASPGSAGSGGGPASTGSAGSGGGAASPGSAGSGGGAASTGNAGGGSAATGSARPCGPLGWATRSGRTGDVFRVTGGGDATPDVVKTFAELQAYAADGRARVIHVDGTLGAGWAGTSGDRLEIKSNKTIVGLRAGTQLKAALHIKDASNVVVRNLVIRGSGSNQDQAWDNLNIEGASTNIWIDHCEFWDGQDGNADVVKGADNVTFSWNVFGYLLPGHSHNYSNLIASSDNEPESEGKLNVTYAFNWWRAATERQPRCRYGHIHLFNNLFTSDLSVGESKLGVTNGYACNVRTENNHFVGQKDPIDLGKQAGPGSVQESLGNLFEGCSGNQQGSGAAFAPPYDYEALMVPASQVRVLVQGSAGATLASPESCH